MSRIATSSVVTASMLFCSGLAIAQAPLLETMTLRAGSDLQLPHQGPGLPPVTVSVPAGTVLTPGTMLENLAGNLHSNWSSWTQVSNRELQVQVHASLSEIVDSDWTASLPEQSVLVQIEVPHAMRLRFDLGVGILIGQGMPSASGSIDIGDDGKIELAFSSPVGVCSGDNTSFELDVPAGTLPVRMSFLADLPAIRDPFVCRAVNVTNLLTVSPAHARVTDEGGGCHTPLWAAPVLDGQSVELGVYGPVTGSLAWLIVGFDTTTVQLPASSCQLLVQPDLLLLDTPWLHQTLPLGLIGPGHLYVQGAIWQPATWFGAPPQFLSTHRHRIDLR